MTDEVKAAVPPAMDAAPAKVEVPEPTREERIEVLLAGYAHGMESNAPRTSAELAEIKALLAG